MRKVKYEIKKGFVKLLGNEKTQFIAIPVFSIIISLIAGSAVIALTGGSPFQAFKNLLQGCGILSKPSYAGFKSPLTDFTSFLNAMTPMLFAALAVSLALKAGLFNIGVSGQMLTAGFIASITVGYAASLPAPLAKLLVLFIGIAAGMLVGGLIGFLKHKFNINEVVSSIMLNYIAQYVIAFFINTKYVDPVSRQSKEVTDASRLTLMGTAVGNLKIDIPLGIVLAVIAAFLLRFLIQRTTAGFEIKAVGASPKAAKYAGMNVGKNIVLTMMISGGLAGLAGVTYFLGYFASIQPKVLPSTGFDAIAVAILGNANPIGNIFSSFLITILSKGSTYMSSAGGVQAEIASVITGIILLCSACGVFIKDWVAKMKEEISEEIKDTQKQEVH